MKKILHVLQSNTFSGAENVVVYIINSLENDYNFVYSSANGQIKETLEENKIKYEFKEYEVDENDLSAIAVSLKTGEDITKIFKTLVLLNEKKEMIVACIPGADTIDLKKLAKIAGAKKVEMLELKELFNMTGYIRGGCSPIGIKKRHQSFIHQSALTKDYIMISAGVRGLQIIIEPQNLINYLKMEVGDITI